MRRQTPLKKIYEVTISSFNFFFKMPEDAHHRGKSTGLCFPQNSAPSTHTDCLKKSFESAWGTISRPSISSSLECSSSRHAWLCLLNLGRFWHLSLCMKYNSSVSKRRLKSVFTNRCLLVTSPNIQLRTLWKITKFSHLLSECSAIIETKGTSSFTVFYKSDLHAKLWFEEKKKRVKRKKERKG